MTDEQINLQNRLTSFNFSTRSCLALSSISPLYCSTWLCSIIFISIWLLRFTTSCSNFFLFFSSFLHFFCISFIDNNSCWKLDFLHPCADILKMQFPALLENHQSSRIKRYCLLMKKVDGAQPNSNPGPNKYDGIWIIECRTRDYSDNQERSSNHQESQNILFTVIFVTQQLHLILHSYCSTIIFFFHLKMTTSHLLVEYLLHLPPS